MFSMYMYCIQVISSQETIVRLEQVSMSFSLLTHRSMYGSHTHYVYVSIVSIRVCLHVGEGTVEAGPAVVRHQV